MGRRHLPVVSENGLLVVDEREGQPTSILIESEDWYQWLAVEQNSSNAQRYGSLLAHALDFLAFEALSQGEYARVRLLLEEGLAIFKELDSKRGMIFSLKAFAYAMFFQKEYPTASYLSC